MSHLHYCLGAHVKTWDGFIKDDLIKNEFTRWLRAVCSPPAFHCSTSCKGKGECRVPFRLPDLPVGSTGGAGPGWRWWQHQGCAWQGCGGPREPCAIRLPALKRSRKEALRLFDACLSWGGITQC